MTVDPRTPVLVGVGQVLQRPATTAESAAPAELMARAIRLAADDTGAGDGLLRHLDSLQVVDQLSWRYPNAAAEVARVAGVEPRETVGTTVGGNTPQTLVNRAASAIAAGQVDVVVICGGEAIYSRTIARKTGGRLPWTTQDSVAPPDRVVGDNRPGTSDGEQRRSLLLPTQVYPLFECALRTAAGETIDEHQIRVSELWARFSDVAATNPFAWSPTALTAEEIRTVSLSNRMVGFPYTKLMNANLQTDQAAALIVCSASAASAARVPTERWVFPWAGSDAHDHWFVSDRRDLHSSPAIKACGRAVLALSGLAADDVTYVDLYSCFPSAVQMGANALGLRWDDPGRPLTVTGGLTFGGGPGNNYVSHSIATMVERLRADPSAHGLITGLGWFATKHSAGVYSASPPPAGFRHAPVQAEVDAQPSRALAAEYVGPVTVETWTVIYERDGEPALGIVAGLTAAGQRAWANTRQPDLMKALTVEDVAGRTATFRADGEPEFD